MVVASLNDDRHILRLESKVWQVCIPVLFCCLYFKGNACLSFLGKGGEVMVLCEYSGRIVLPTVHTVSHASRTHECMVF